MTTENKLRKRIGLFIIGSHFSLIILVASLFVLGGFLFDEMTTTIAIIVPMFSVYTSAIIKNIIAERTVLNDRSPPVSGQYVLLSWALPSVFVAAIFAVVMLKAFNLGFSSFEEFKGVLMAAEAVFGAYVGLVIGSMFDLKREAEAAGEDRG